MTAPIVRIILRYLVGALFSPALADMLVNDPDVVNVCVAALSAAAGIATEIAYGLAKRWGWTT